MTRRLAAIALAAAAVAACATTQAPRPGPADAARAAERWPGTTVAELDDGRTLYLGHCGSCHLPPSPRDVPADDWPRHVAEMAERSGLDATAQERVERYLVTMAAAPAGR